MKLLTTISLLFLVNCLFAQQKLSGYVNDETGTPIPFAKIFVKNDPDNRTLADANGYYEMRLYRGEYFLIIQVNGYQTKEVYVTVNDMAVTQNIQIFPENIQAIENVDVRVKKYNPGREIILKVVNRRDTINMWNFPHSVNVSIKASEDIDRKEKEIKSKKKREKIEQEQVEAINNDPFAVQKKEIIDFSRNMNIIEVNLLRHWGGNNKVKEIRNAYNLKGSERNELYYTSTIKSNFNFFKNLLLLDDLHQTPVSSPISGPGILSYKYRLVDQYEENGQKIHKIQIIDRSTSSTTLSGFIYVYDSIWMIQKLDLSMQKGNLLIYDYFKIEQEYDNYGDTLSVLKSQKLSYGVKYKNSESTCTTVANFTDYNFEPNFEEKFFNNELSITEEEAYKKDSNYWNDQRQIELTEKEKDFIRIKDSIYDYTHRQEYLDSIDADFNKVTALKVLWFGIDHRNRPKKIQWTFSSAAGFIRPIFIAGPRIAPGFNYFKKWENGNSIDGYSEVSVGILNGDIKGNTNWDFIYDPFHFGRFRMDFGHGFDVIRGYDAITQIYKRDNFIEATSLSVGHSYEILNGLFLDTDFEFTERRSLIGYKFLDTDDFLENNDPTEFESYQAGILSINLSYTPQQKYMREPNRKVILGSKWPTFYAYYEKGVPTLFGSDVNHDYLLGGIMQTFKIGTIGTSKYHVKTGAFLNSKVLKDADQKFHRRSDPIWFSNPLHSFQALDSTMPTRKMYFEGHFVHHDNGAIINKIPFMKKTRIGLVVGFGALYVPEFDWQHYELIFGLERNIKFSKRRLRIGVYGVLADGNRMAPRATWKVSFALLDNRNMKWNF